MKLKERVKKGRRVYGAIYSWSQGEFYLAWRQPHEIFRSGEKTISDAVRKGVACWALDDDTLLKMRSRGIKFVGVLIKESGEGWITTVDIFRASKVLNYEARGGSLQRYLPISDENFKSFHIR